MRVSGMSTPNAFFAAHGLSFYPQTTAWVMLRKLSEDSMNPRTGRIKCIPLVSHHPFFTSKVRAACGVCIQALTPQMHLTVPHFPPVEMGMFQNIQTLESDKMNFESWLSCPYPWQTHKDLVSETRLLDSKRQMILNSSRVGVWPKLGNVCTE